MAGDIPNIAEQIELAYQDGRKAGIREVMEWVREYRSGRLIFETMSGRAKLKEWGIGG